jgi:hypothetical protein
MKHMNFVIYTFTKTFNLWYRTWKLSKQLNSVKFSELAATSGGWTASKPMFWVSSLFFDQRTEKLTSELLISLMTDRDGSQNVGLPAVQSSDVAASPERFIETRLIAILMTSAINQPNKSPRAETCTKSQSPSCSLFSHSCLQKTHHWPMAHVHDNCNGDRA